MKDGWRSVERASIREEVSVISRSLSSFRCLRELTSASSSTGRVVMSSSLPVFCLFLRFFLLLVILRFFLMDSSTSELLSSSSCSSSSDATGAAARQLLLWRLVALLLPVIGHVERQHTSYFSLHTCVPDSLLWAPFPRLVGCSPSLISISWSAGAPSLAYMRLVALRCGLVLLIVREQRRDGSKASCGGKKRSERDVSTRFHLPSPAVCNSDQSTLCIGHITRL